MSLDELKYKEQVLRSCFKEKLAYLNVEGNNDIQTVKCVKTYGALWHYAHQLLLAEMDSENKSGSETTAETMNIQATGLKMTGGKNA